MEKEFHCLEFVKNYDGDTVTVNIPGIHPFFGKKMSIRVNGIDTPEIRTKDKCEKVKGKLAKSIVFNLCSRAKSIKLKNVSKGKYFRIVGDLYCDGKLVSQELIKKKLAVKYDGGTKTKVNWCTK
jgi:endonuclease YncB( thermonuclease family)